MFLELIGRKTIVKINDLNDDEAVTLISLSKPISSLKEIKSLKCKYYDEHTDKTFPAIASFKSDTLKITFTVDNKVITIILNCQSEPRLILGSLIS